MAMSRSMAVGTQGNQVVQFVVSECAAKVDVLNFELSCTSARLSLWRIFRQSAW